MAGTKIKTQWNNPRILDTPEKVKEANELSPTSRIDQNPEWRLGDHCPYYFVPEESKA